MKKETTNKSLPTLSLVVSTYNSIAALELALKSIARQTDLPEEVIIADDGSTDETRLFVEAFRERSNLPLMHCWQEDRGFRLAAIRNRAIAQARGEYIVMIDGDIVLHRDFIAEHRRNARAGYFLQGSRVILSEDLTKKLLTGRIKSVSFFSGGIKNKHNTLHFSWLARLLPPFDRLHFRKIKGCNASFWKADLVRVNGYNEAFLGWGSEDKELAVRLYNTGLKMKWLKCSAICYHLAHPLHVDKDLLRRNDKLLEQAIVQGDSRCEQGIDRYL